MWQRLKGWSPLSSGKYLIKFFSFSSLPPPLPCGPRQDMGVGSAGTEGPRGRREMQRGGTGCLRETLDLTNGAPLPSWWGGNASWWPLATASARSHSIPNKGSLLQGGREGHPQAFLFLAGTGKSSATASLSALRFTRISAPSLC